MVNTANREENREKYLPDFLLRRRGYVCRELLGQGAFAKVYSVEEQSAGRLYACKVSGKPELLEKEARILAELCHPVFPEYVDFWEEAGFGFFLREYVLGSSMEDMLRLQGAFSAREVARMGMELAEGLHYLHSRPNRYLFRDVKPANIIIEQDGGPKLIDLGCVCAMTEAGQAYAGTPGFAAPEQLHGTEALTPACDVYALGQTLKAALGKRSTGLRERRDRKRLMGVLDACTQEEASRRIPDMDSLLSALSCIIA